MHIPKLYKSEDFELLKEIISNHSFGLLISSKEKTVRNPFYVSNEWYQ